MKNPMELLAIVKYEKMKIIISRHLQEGTKEERKYVKKSMKERTKDRTSS